MEQDDDGTELCFGVLHCHIAATDVVDVAEVAVVGGCDRLIFCHSGQLCSLSRNKNGVINKKSDYFSVFENNDHCLKKKLQEQKVSFVI